MKFHPCFILIPMRYGRSGRPLTPEGVTQILAVLTRQFGGFTPLGMTASPPGVLPGGQWVDPDTGETVPDETFRIMVAVAPDRLPTFRKLVNVIGLALEQKEMFIDIQEPSVEFHVVKDEPDDPEQSQFFNYLDQLFEEDDDQTSGAATG